MDPQILELIKVLAEAVVVPMWGMWLTHNGTSQKAIEHLTAGQNGGQG